MLQRSNSPYPDGPNRHRVLLLLSSLNGGGAERTAVMIANRLDKTIFDVRIGLLRGAGQWMEQVDPAQLLIAPNGERYFNYEANNNRLYRLDKLLPGATRAPKAFRQMIDDFQPDVVMSFLKGTNLITWRAMLGMGANRPAWIVRDGNNALAVIEDELKSPLLRKGMRALVSRIYKTADAILANSTDMAEGFIKDLGVARTRTRIVHNPIDIEGITLRSLAKPGRLPARPFILTVGRLARQKGQDDLISAYAQSASRSTHDLVILGTGRDEAMLRAHAASLGVADIVHFPGFDANPYGWMSRADLFVLPSRWEGFPTVGAEAQALGVPTLMTDFAFGARDIVEHGKSGWIVPPNDPATLKDGIDMMIADPALRARFAAAGKLRARNWALDSMLDRYGKLFLDLSTERSNAYAGISVDPLPSLQLSHLAS